MPGKEPMSGFREAQKITQRFAKSFYLASLFLPKEQRYASYAVYAICRLSDQTVDDAGNPQQEQSLVELENRIRAAYDRDNIEEPLLLAFRDTVNKYSIPKEYFDSLIKGMRMDLEIKRYPDFPFLREYCYNVAGVVGLIMLKIFGYNDKAAEDYAVKMGIAMQLTNILRDINEDFSRGRIYLPLDEMARFKVAQDRIAEKDNDENFKRLMRFQIERARRFYEESLPGIGFINNASCRFTALCMQGIYSGILEAIERNGYDVFTRRAHTTGLQKAAIVLKILMTGKYL